MNRERLMSRIPIDRSLRSVGSPPSRASETPRSRRPIVWWALGVLAVLGSSIAGVQAFRRSRRLPQPVYRTDVVTSGAVVGVLTAEGPLQTLTAVRVGSTSAGQIVSVFVDIGDKVKRGQPLARLDDLEERAAVADATASFNAAEIRRARLEKHLGEELDKLDDAGLSAGDIGQDDVLSGAAGDAQLDLMSAYVQVDRTTTKRALARGVLARRLIRSPIDGVVLARTVDPGETIGDSPPGPPLFVIGSDPAHLRIAVEIDDRDVGRVQPAPIALTVPDCPRRSFTAHILQVLPAPPFAVSSGHYRAFLDVENADGALRPGMLATFALPMQTAASAVSVPLAALTPAPPHSGKRDAIVWVVDARGVRTSVPVELGVTNDRVAEIRAGSLRPGTTVVVAATP